MPTTTIRPSAWIATSLAPSSPPVKVVVTFPFPLNVESRLPSRSNRATANRWTLAVTWTSPTATILPSCWIATPKAAFDRPTKSMITRPSSPKVGSSDPFVR